MTLKTKGYVREGYKQTIGNSILFADAIADGKETIYFEMLVEDKKENVIVVLDSYVDAMHFAMSLMVKVMEHLLGKR
jgi:hypothetical protein